MDQASESDPLFPIAVLIDELKHEDTVLRLNAIHRLSDIALALGPERTRDELIPFLDESVEDEDEVLTALSEELGNLVEDVGGPEFAHVLLSPLENLAAIEEPLVRDKAVESLVKICKQLSPAQVEEHFIPLVFRLAKADWFTSKISATGLFCVPYKRSPPNVQQELRQHFGDLVHDETPMVRRQAANNLAKLVGEIDSAEIAEGMIPLFQYLANDDQDSVRLLTVDILIAIADSVPKANRPNSLLLVALHHLFEDKSWRVRYMIADRFEAIANCVGGEGSKKDLAPAFVKLLKDTEAEVRTAIAGQIPGFCRLLDKETLLRDIIPSVEDLATDQSQHVRAALGLQISGLSPILGKEETIQHLLPMFLLMLKDDFPDVRLHIISKLESVNKVIGIEPLSESLLPAIMNLANDEQWRVRLAIIEYIPLLAAQFGVKFFDEQLKGLCIDFLSDKVSSIRAAATKNFKQLTEVFGVEWVSESIIPQIITVDIGEGYHRNMTTCAAISILAPVLNLDIVEAKFLPVLEELSTNAVPNIRFSVAKSCEVLIQSLRSLPEHGTSVDASKPAAGEANNKPPSPAFAPRNKAIIESRILPILQNLQQKDEPDVDVRYFAARAESAYLQEPREGSGSGSGGGQNGVSDSAAAVIIGSGNDTAQKS